MISIKYTYDMTFITLKELASSAVQPKGSGKRWEEKDIAPLLAYLISGGDAKNEVFSKE
ncbi:hypothetical protein ACU8V7_03700 [Zobellia nedashkovskayae]